MASIQGKTVLITGAASGIGRRLAEKVAARGGRVVGWDLDRTGLDRLLAALPGTGHRGDVVDVSDRARVKAAAEAVLASGPVDVLVNNAGIVSGRTLLEISDERIEATMAVNALALFWTTRAFLPEMIRRNSGHVLTVASAAGLVGVRGLADYSASKFAAVGFDEALRMELARVAPGVGTTVVCPYFIDTGMFEGARTRFSWLLPILREDDVARRMLDAIERNRRRVILPWTVHLLAPLRALPVGLFDTIVTFLGVNASMDHFRGRTATPPATAAAK